MTIILDVDLKEFEVRYTRWSYNFGNDLLPGEGLCIFNRELYHFVVEEYPFADTYILTSYASLGWYEKLYWKIKIWFNF